MEMELEMQIADDEFRAVEVHVAACRTRCLSGEDALASAAAGPPTAHPARQPPAVAAATPPSSKVFIQPFPRKSAEHFLKAAGRPTRARLTAPGATRCNQMQ